MCVIKYYIEYSKNGIFYKYNESTIKLKNKIIKLSDLYNKYLNTVMKYEYNTDYLNIVKLLVIKENLLYKNKYIIHKICMQKIYTQF